MATGRDLVASAETCLGKPYNAAIGCRCSINCPAQDCSGLVCGCYTQITGQNICTSSFGLATWGLQAGTLISEGQAINTPGALGIENAWGTSNGFLGSNGHVVIMKGDGQTTVEEMGHAYGCVRG